MKLSDIKLGSGPFKAIFKGTPATGKSCAALSFPRPMYIFDLDGRSKSLINWAGISGFKDLLEGVEYDYYPPQAYQALDQKLAAIKQSNPYKTIVFDSLTAAADILIEYGLALRGSGKSRGIVKLAGPEDFGVEASGLTSIFDVFKGLKCNVIITAHVVESQFKNLDGSTRTERTLMTAGKKIAAKIPVYFDEAFHFIVETPINVSGENKYKLYTSHAGDDWAKTALPLPKVIEFTGKRLYPVMQDILKEKGVDF